MSFKWIYFILIPGIISSCTNGEEKQIVEEPINNETSASPRHLFNQIPASESGIHFNNRISEDNQSHYFKYNYFYNGAGIGVGDVNQDNLVDLYFAGNQVGDKLYLNKGDFKFEEVTTAAGIGEKAGWSTGVSMVDINADGFLDIYVCRAGPSENPEDRANLLYINQRNGSFEERADQLGLNDMGYSTQAYFFDYDKDGDLDALVVNHRTDFNNNTKISTRIMQDIKPEFSDQLYRNDNGTFTNVSAKAGISNRAWGLSCSLGDFNEDGWTDIYIANDFLEPDFLYINQGDGTFKESAMDYLNHISFYGMGSDMADINNDGLRDLVVLDMVSDDHVKSKRNMASMSNDNFWSLVRVGYHYQYMLNTLQLNQGKGNFSEIASLAGISKSDWSWAPLLADFDLDGDKDLFVTNGIKRDVTDNDFKIEINKRLANNEEVSPQQALSMLPSSMVSNYAFENHGDLTFHKVHPEWGIDQKLNSNGAAYADLDLDGDLDLITNNMDSKAGVWKNGASQNGQYWIALHLNGPSSNPFGIGSKVTLRGGSEEQTIEVYPNRGFMSSMVGPVVFGIGRERAQYEITVEWPDGKISTLENVVPRDRFSVNYNGAQNGEREKMSTDDYWFAEVTPTLVGLDFRHMENEYDDFIKEILIPHRQSMLGPCLETADVNSDGLEDVFVGGASGQAGELFLQGSDGKFAKGSSQPWKTETISEDLGAAFFDLEGDGDMDLYIASGGNEFEKGHKNYRDRIYLNDGNGNFNKGSGILPNIASSTMAIAVGDYDGDGDNDLFVGGRTSPAEYPYAPQSTLLVNENGKFKDVTPDHLRNVGMVTDAQFVDYNADGRIDLVLVGEWMGVEFFKNDGNQFAQDPEMEHLSEMKGWWFSLTPADIDQDGDMDFIAGNIGLNNKFQPSAKKPLHVYCTDFDENGSLDIVLSKTKNETLLPLRGRECSSQQMPFIQDKFPSYKSFAEADLIEIYGQEKLDEAIHLYVNEFAHQVIINNDGKFSAYPLPVETQISPLNDIIAFDLDNDGTEEWIGVGNFHMSEVETVRYDAGMGIVMKYDGDELINLPPAKTGLYVKGDSKGIARVTTSDGVSWILVSQNNSPLKIFKIQKSTLPI